MKFKDLKPGDKFIHDNRHYVKYSAPMLSYVNAVCLESMFCTEEGKGFVVESYIEVKRVAYGMATELRE